MEVRIQKALRSMGCPCHLPLSRYDKCPKGKALDDLERSPRTLMAKNVPILAPILTSYVIALVICLMATHSSILAWRIPWTEEPAELRSMGSQRVGHDWPTNTLQIPSPSRPYSVPRLPSQLQSTKALGEGEKLRMGGIAPLSRVPAPWIPPVLSAPPAPGLAGGFLRLAVWFLGSPI